MSIHSSLRTSTTSAGQRNVWTRLERILALKKAGGWKDGDKVTGLRKVRTSFKTKSKKKDEPKEAKPAAGAAAAAPAAKAAPAAAAKPAAKK